jgi:hypothetical protein
MSLSLSYGVNTSSASTIAQIINQTSRNNSPTCLKVNWHLAEEQILVPNLSFRRLAMSGEADGMTIAGKEASGQMPASSASLGTTCKGMMVYAPSSYSHK